MNGDKVICTRLVNPTRLHRVISTFDPIYLFIHAQERDIRQMSLKKLHFSTNVSSYLLTLRKTNFHSSVFNYSFLIYIDVVYPFLSISWQRWISRERVSISKRNCMNPRYTFYTFPNTYGRQCTLLRRQKGIALAKKRARPKPRRGQASVAWLALEKKNKTRWNCVKAN